MLSKNLLSLFLCFFKKSDALYLFSTNWLLLIVINKFTMIEFAPFSLVTKRAFSTFGKITNTERTIPLIFALVAATYFAD